MNRALSIGLALLAGGLLATVQAAAPVAPDPAVAGIIESRCALCHGKEGQSASAIYPRLAAQHPDYLVKQLKDFRDGRRKSDTMAEMVRGLSDAEAVALAAWFSTRPAGARRAGDPDLAAVGRYLYTRGNTFSGVAACASCHGERGHGTQQLPRLAGQHPAYLETQLQEFGKRERTNDNAVMHSIAARLTALEMRALSVYLGGLE